MAAGLHPVDVLHPVGHWADEQSPLAQATSHLHASEQSTAPHAPWAWHFTAHAPVPHATSPQDFADAQVTAHEPASSQWTVLQALLPEHAMVQSKPAGQVGVQRSPELQLMVQLLIPRSHESHPAGQSRQ